MTFEDHGNNRTRKSNFLTNTSEINKSTSNFLKLVNYRRIFFLAFFLLINAPIFADDPGITKVRLIQETETSYVFEIDIAQSLLWTIKAPIFPQRFEISNTDNENNAGWITIKVRFETEKEPLNKADEIILPWTRNGVDITVQWLDGGTYKGLFRRSLDGIHIPLKQLMTTQKTTKEVLGDGFLMGLVHFPFKMIHILLIFLLVWAVPSFKVFRYLIAMTLGKMLAMIFIELGVPGIDILLSDLFLVIIIFLISYSVIYKIKFKYLGIILFLAGAIHALSFGHELQIIDLTSIQRVQSLYAFNIAMDLANYCIALAFLFLVTKYQRYTNNTNWIPIITGGLSVFLVLLIFSEYVSSGKMRILDMQSSPVAVSYKSSAKGPRLSTAKGQRGKGLMTTPLMIYLSVKPFEVREEILVQASVATEYFYANEKNSLVIPIESQEHLKEEIQEAITKTTTTYINNQLVVPSKVIANFVTLGRGGVASRDMPVEEITKDAIIGITLIYDTESFPDSVTVHWQLFPDSLQSIEVSAVDPHGAFTTILSPVENTINWKSRLTGYKVPAIKAIEIEKKPKPLISYILWLAIILIVIYWIFYKRPEPIKQWAIIVLVVSFAFYPFIRWQFNIPIIPQGKPSSEKASVILSDLLTNVYRAFDRRDEEVVYDRLALSVSQNQLSEIFIQNRQSMALENRGGARASVDEVNIQELYTVDHDENGGYIADTQWTVRGSVNHFGHTHYRQNQYRALVSFDVENNIWKINNIEILDTKRLY